MRHNRSIDLTPPDNQIVAEFRYLTFEELPQWMMLIARCGKCGNISEVDRHALQRKFGSRAYVSSVAPRLKCSLCGNKQENRFFLEKMPR